MASKKEELQQEKDKKAQEAFVAEINAVEMKHRLKFIAMLEYHSQGLVPVLGLQKVDKVNLDLKTKEKKVKK